MVNDIIEMMYCVGDNVRGGIQGKLVVFMGQMYKL